MYTISTAYNDPTVNTRYSRAWDACASYIIVQANIQNIIPHATCMVIMQIMKVVRATLHLMPDSDGWTLVYSQIISA